MKENLNVITALRNSIQKFSDINISKGIMKKMVNNFNVKFVKSHTKREKLYGNTKEKIMKK